MSTTIRTASAVLMGAAVVGALAMLVAGLPARAETERYQAVLDFGSLAPGVAQTRSSELEVPVRSEVASAGVVRASGVASAVEWTFRICGGSTPCTHLITGDTVDPGTYTLEVSAMLPVDASADVSGEAGSVVGRVQLNEDAPGGIAADRALLAIVAAVIVGLVLAMASTGRRRELR